LDLVECRPLITGAARGIGRAFVREFLNAGAPVVYAGARSDAACADLAAIDPRVVPLRLDTRDLDQVAAAAVEARDLNVLVNNAGVERTVSFLNAPSMDDARAEMETNYFGVLAMARAFAPRLIAARGVMVNVLSIAALATVPELGSYSASKAAARALTQGLRAELNPDGVRIIAVYAGPYDTDMAWHVPEAQAAQKNPPELLTSAVRAALADGGPDDIFPDPVAQQFRRMADEDLEGLVKMLADSARINRATSAAI
jgi:NAD(P)-dependent dehydrogenase (short-subunit alcohol dehydrogenase family)